MKKSEANTVGIESNNPADVLAAMVREYAAHSGQELAEDFDVQVDELRVWLHRSAVYHSCAPASDPAWKTESPVDEGYYWVRRFRHTGDFPFGFGEAKIVRVEPCGGELTVMFAGREESYYLSQIEAEWQGPLAPDEGKGK